MNAANTKEFTFPEHAEVSHEKTTVEMKHTSTGTVTTTMSERRFTPSSLHVVNPAPTVTNVVTVVTKDNTAEGETVSTETIRSYVPVIEEYVEDANVANFFNVAQGTGQEQEAEQDEKLDRLENNLGVILSGVGELAMALDVHQGVLLQLTELPEDVADMMKFIVEEQAKFNLALTLRMDMIGELIGELQEEVGALLDDALPTFVPKDAVPDGSAAPLMSYTDTSIEIALPPLPTLPTEEAIHKVLQHLRDLNDFAAYNLIISEEKYDIICGALTIGSSAEEITKILDYNSDENLSEVLHQWIDDPAMVGDGHTSFIVIANNHSRGDAFQQIITYILRTTAAAAYAMYMHNLALSADMEA